jgi:type 1 glutamine amidotransferase
VSLMPTGLIDALKEADVKDLLTFLQNEPPVHTREEARKAVAALPSPAASDRKVNIVLVASKQDHGADQHDYPAWQKTWHGLLVNAPGTSVADAWQWPTPEQFQSASVIVFYYWNHEWTDTRYQELDHYLARGGGVVILHSATIEDKEPEKLSARIGLAAQPQRTKYAHTPLELQIATDSPLTAGLPHTIRLIDEPYWPMIGDAGQVQALATARREGAERPLVWTFHKGRGRVFASVMGHYTWTLNDPLFRVLLLRGIGWAAGEPAARFQDLTTASQ